MTDTSFDMSALSAKHTGDASRRRLRKRHWADIRLRIWGILAIGLAVSALIVLLITVVTKAVGVRSEYYLSLETQIEVSDRHMQRIVDPNPRLLPSLDKIVRAAIIDATGEEIGRRERRKLTSLLSTDAGLELGKAVKLNRDLIGGRYQYDALFDDQVQLYLKGDFGRLQPAGSETAIEITAGEDDSTVKATFPASAFTDARALLQADRALEARNVRRTARDQERAFNETKTELDATSDPEARKPIEAALENFRALRDASNAKADRALAQATSQTASFQLKPDDPSVLIRVARGWIKVTELGPDVLTGTVVQAPQRLGGFEPTEWSAQVFARPEAERKINDRQMLWLENFKLEGKVNTRTNWRLLSSSDSSNAELAGIWGALVGSFWTMIVTFLLAFPIGVMSSIYLEEFAPKNKLTELIEVNINNLAAVPSIVFGLLGITVLISGVQLFGIELFDGLLKSITEDPRSTPLAGGVVLALMSLPTIIIAARASIKAVPPSIRDAALGLGASRLQTTSHHVLPLAMPGILTGSIISMAQALGETAPLIIVGMNAFIQDPPSDPLDKANVLPSLIYLWNNQSERLFDGKTAMAISVLLVFLVLMNALAVLLRKRFERRW